MVDLKTISKKMKNVNELELAWFFTSGPLPIVGSRKSRTYQSILSRTGVNLESIVFLLTLCEIGLYLISCKTFFNSTATASPTSAVLAVPPMSFVRIPFSIVLLTANSTAFDSIGRLREYWSIMATERIVPTGLTIPCPPISGADPKLC